MARSNNNSALLWKLGLGVSPIPVVGEIALCMGFYDLFKENSMLKAASVPAALLTRFAMYQNIFIPLYERLGLTHLF